MDRSEWNEITRQLTERECEGMEAPTQTREQLEAKHGQVWDSYTLARDYEVESFSGHCVVATRRTDGKRGVLVFQRYPRYYWGFK